MKTKETATKATTAKLTALPAMPKSARKARAQHECECGCGMLTGARFVPGHDSRLRGWALRLERGVVTPDAFPGTDGELRAAMALLHETGRDVPRDEAQAS